MKKFIVYLSRDKSGDLCISMLEPVKYADNDSEYHEEQYGMLYIDKKLFRDITFKSGPAKAEFVDYATVAAKDTNLAVKISKADHGSIRINVPCPWDPKRLNYGCYCSDKFIKGTWAEERIMNGETVYADIQCPEIISSADDKTTYTASEIKQMVTSMIINELSQCNDGNLVDMKYAKGFANRLIRYMEEKRN